MRDAEEKDSLLVNHIDIHLGEFSTDCADLDQIEQGLDANEFLSQESFVFDDLQPSTSQSSRHPIPNGTESGLPSVPDATQQQSDDQPYQSASSSPSGSSLSRQQAVVSVPNYDHPPFEFPSSAGSFPALGASSMIPIVSGPSSSSTATTLLLPPIWIPDELASTCRSCAQVFNLIRRRHHCRHCGHIFCHQCSNNFISLKCFGYAKPVRVCNDCLVLHQHSLEQTVSGSTSFGA